MFLYKNLYFRRKIKRKTVYILEHENLLIKY